MQTYTEYGMSIHMAGKQISVFEVAILEVVSPPVAFKSNNLKSTPSVSFLSFQVNSAWNDRTIFLEKKGALGSYTIIYVHQIKCVPFKKSTEATEPSIE